MRGSTLLVGFYILYTVLLRKYQEELEKAELSRNIKTLGWSGAKLGKIAREISLLEFPTHENPGQEEKVAAHPRIKAIPSLNIL